MEDLILLGGGGHAKACIDVIQSSGIFRVAGILDVEEKIGQDVLGCRIVDSDKNFATYSSKYSNFFLGLGQIKSHEKRKALFEMVKHHEKNIPIIISPRAYISPYSSLGEGTIVMHGVMVNAGALVGKNCILNTASLIEHDCTIGDHCHVAVGAVIGGDCSIGEGTFVGANATLVNGVRIAPGTVVGAGAVVTINITVPGIYVGNPAKKINE